MANVSVRIENSINRDIDDLAHVINSCGIRYMNIDEKDVVNLLISYIQKEMQEEEIESALLTPVDNETKKKVLESLKPFMPATFIESFQSEYIIKTFSLNDDNFKYLRILADKYKKKNSDILRALLKFLKDPETIKAMLTWHLVFQGITSILIDYNMKKTNPQKTHDSFINFEVPAVHIYSMDKENFQRIYEKMQTINSYDMVLKNAKDYKTDPELSEIVSKFFKQTVGGRRKDLPPEVDSASATAGAILSLSMPNVFAIKLVTITYVYSLFKLENPEDTLGAINFIDEFIMFYTLKNQPGIQGNYKAVYTSVLKWLKTFNEYFNKF